jgi:PAS domain S-box-containing protein
MPEEVGSRLRSLAVLLEENAEDLYEHAPCGYLSLSQDGLILRANTTFSAMTGRSVESLVGVCRFLDLLSPGGRVFYETHFGHSSGCRALSARFALDISCGDGSQLPVLVNAIERKGSGGDTVIRITVFDATDRRRYERELLLARRAAEEAAQARSELIEMVSHDVRAPLSALLIAVAMLEKTDPAPVHARYIRVIRSSADRALTLLNSILDLSSIDSGRAVLREKPVELRQMVEQIMSDIMLTAAHKTDLAVTATVDQDVPPIVIGDRDKIAQVLTNLLTNAVKFTDRASCR